MKLSYFFLLADGRHSLSLFSLSILSPCARVLGSLGWTSGNQNYRCLNKLQY